MPDSIDVAVVIRLHVYFDGEHSLEEMMWLENLSRDELLQALDLFHPVIERVAW